MAFLKILQAFSCSILLPGKCNTALLDENSQPGPVPFLTNGNYLSFKHISYLCMKNINTGLCVSVSLFPLDYDAHQFAHNPTLIHFSLLLFYPSSVFYPQCK